MNRKAKRTKRAKPRPIPAGYHAVTPYLAVRGAAAAIDFYKKAFNAKEAMRMPGPDGKVGHAELTIGDARIMLADEYEDMDFLGPQARGGSPVHMLIYVKDVDATVKKAESLGAKLVRPIEDKFYGDRTGALEDPFGHLWHVATHVEDVPKKELQRRAAQMAGKS